MECLCCKGGRGVGMKRKKEEFFGVLELSLAVGVVGLFCCFFSFSCTRLTFFVGDVWNKAQWHKGVDCIISFAPVGSRFARSRGAYVRHPTCTHGPRGLLLTSPT